MISPPSVSLLVVIESDLYRVVVWPDNLALLIKE